MKQITLLALASVFFISCSDDGTNNVSIDGTWKLTKIIVADVHATDMNEDGITSTDFMVETGCYNNSTLEFGENNTAVFKSEDVHNDCNFTTPDNVTYEVNGSNVTFYHQITEEGSLCTTFKKSGNKLTATLSDHMFPYYIPTDGEGGEYYTLFLGATFVYTKQ